MAKRMVDGEGLWLSNKLNRVPEKYRAEYANLIPLALANGTFECDVRKVWSRVYSYNRPDVHVENVEEMLECFEHAKMLFRWKTEAGAEWGFWVGIDKPGRLPAKTHRNRYASGEHVPQQQLAAFLAQENHLPPDKVRTDSGLSPTMLGFGLGLGLEKHICADSNRPHGSVSSPKPKPPEENLGAVLRVWGFYLATLHKNSKILTFTTGRKQKGLARLAEALKKTSGDLAKAEGLMRCAVEALAASTFHMGDNPSKKKYDSWEDNLFKSAEQFEKWLERT